MSSNSDRVAAVINRVRLGTSIAGVTLSILLLVAIACLLWNPVARPQLDRVSFRLLTYAVVANVVLGATMWPNMEETTPGCSLIGFLGVGSSLFSACMLGCMALSLQLVLVHRVNGNKMEKYYMLGAVLFTGACTVPTLAVGEYGWYATNGLCWLRDPTPTIQLHWLIATQSVPTLLMSTVEVVSFVNIITFMVRHHTKIRHLQADPSINSSTSRLTSLASGSSLPQHPIKEFRSMIIRIALYPLLSCFLSTTTCILDVYSVMDPNLTYFPVNLRIFGPYPIPELFCLDTDISPHHRFTRLFAPPSSVCPAGRHRSPVPTSRALTAPEAINAAYGYDPERDRLGGVRLVWASVDTSVPLRWGINALLPQLWWEHLSSRGEPEGRPSTVDEEALAALAEEESRSDNIAHQIQCLRP
ncbi:hypothetical protein B0H19DRAFT_1255340 [Mycena capillaripes]|nr:hypothetical protein B0H19DRAFT_1255340 [Mycena capillaripes]